MNQLYVYTSAISILYLFYILHKLTIYIESLIPDLTTFQLTYYLLLLLLLATSYLLLLLLRLLLLVV